MKIKNIFSLFSKILLHFAFGLIFFIYTAYCEINNPIPFQCEDNKYGFKDSETDEIIINCKYSAVDNFNDGLAKVTIKLKNIGNKYGYIDKTGAEIIPIKYDKIFEFSEGLAVVRVLLKISENYQYKYGYIDKTGKEIIPIKYDNANDFINGRAAVELNKKKKIIDNKGNEVDNN